MTRRSAIRRGGRPYRRLAAQLKRQCEVCALCGLPIDKTLPAMHPMAFTVDHVVPVSMGGALTDPGNVRAAHRLCNMKRGTGRRGARTPGDRSAAW